MFSVIFYYKICESTYLKKKGKFPMMVLQQLITTHVPLFKQVSRSTMQVLSLTIVIILAYGDIPRRSRVRTCYTKLSSGEGGMDHRTPISTNQKSSLNLDYLVFTQ